MWASSWLWTLKPIKKVVHRKGTLDSWYRKEMWCIACLLLSIFLINEIGFLFNKPKKEKEQEDLLWMQGDQWLYQERKKWSPELSRWHPKLKEKSQKLPVNNVNCMKNKNLTSWWATSTGTSKCWSVWITDFPDHSIIWNQAFRIGPRTDIHPIPTNLSHPIRNTNMTWPQWKVPEEGKKLRTWRDRL